MNSHTVTIQFYLPCTEAQFLRLPKGLDDYARWQSSETELKPYTGRYHWVLQTYLHLLAAGEAVELVREMPREGVVLAHIETLPYELRPTRELLLVPLLVDKDVPLPYAPLHITHNLAQRLPLAMRSHYMPPWPQIGLIPRAGCRRDRFETVSFLGFPENLHPSLAGESFTRRLQALGLKLHIAAPSCWHDFSEVDAVLAVRNFGRETPHLTKPALKLYNAWLAGVPAIIGHETACRTEGRPGEDYVEATDETQVCAALERLTTDLAFRRRVIAAGLARMAQRDTESLRRMWAALIRDELVPLQDRWRNDRAYRAGFALAGQVRERLLWRRPGWFTEDSRVRIAP